MIASLPRKWSIRPSDAVELPRGGQIASEEFFDNHTGVLAQIRGTKPLDHYLE